MTLAHRAGGALLWRGLAIGGENIIFLVRLVILARLLVPEDFGLVAIGLVALAIAMSLTEFGIIAALIQQPAPNKRHLDTAWTINLVRGVVVTVFLFITAPWIAGAFGDERATDIIRALALTALFHSSASIEVARLNRELQFRGLAAIGLSGAVVNTLVAVVLASTYGVWALVWGSLAGAAVHALISYFVAPYRPALHFSPESSAKLLRFGRWIFLVSVLGIAGDAIVRWMIAAHMSVVELGVYFMAARLAFLPTQLLYGLVSEIAFPVYSLLQENPAKAAVAFRSLLISVAALLMPIAIVFAWLAPAIVEHLLGDQWRAAASVMQLLILSSVIGLLGEGMTPVLKGIGQPAGIAAMESVQVAVFVLVGGPLIGEFGLVGAGIALMSGVFVSQLLALRYARKVFVRPFAGLAAPMATIGAAALLATAAAAVTVEVLPGLVGLIVGVVLAGLAATIVLLWTDRVFGLGIVRTLIEPFPRLRVWLEAIGVTI
ncbi:lipopolysaccharide biosynthesis protein [Thioalkalivibrio sp.]|uniref:lipopolysaccharide biosynthesis protein n=1 Tax=Thioalkalivibrio sp. TaxID=2093813 RepID=UPI003564A35E